MYQVQDLLTSDLGSNGRDEILYFGRNTYTVVVVDDLIPFEQTPIKIATKQT